MCGADGGPPVVLLPGGRSTSAGWYANVGALAPVHRVYAVDILGDAGRSVPGGEPVASRDDIVAWLDGVLDGLGLDAAALGGHSYGGWIAARYAIARPERVSSLVLVDPADTFSATPLGFRLRGIPLFLGRDRFRRFHQWETGGRPVDPEFLDLWAGPFGGPRAGRFVWPAGSSGRKCPGRPNWPGSPCPCSSSPPGSHGRTRRPRWPRRRGYCRMRASW